MNLSLCSRSLVAVLLSLAIVALSSAQTEQAAPARPSKDSSQEMLKDYVHYVNIAHVELANAKGQAIIDANVPNSDLATALDEVKDLDKRFQEAVDKAMRNPEMEGIAAELWRRAEAGELELMRDPKRIEEAVKMLGGMQRERLVGKQRLLAAKEYAVPPLLKEITDGTNAPLKIECQKVLEDLGRHAVAPLNIAVINLTGVSQRVAAEILGTIKHPQAAPYLREVSLSGAEQEAKDAAKRAFDRLGVTDAPLSTLYSNLARNYFDGHESLVAFPDEATNNVWRYNNFTGLSPQPVPTPIFTDVMALELAAKAVALDASNSTGLSLFVASDLKRENDLPEGGVDPIYGDNKYTPDFYATIFGTQTCLEVLALAIDKLDTPLVRDAISSLSKTTGGANLFARPTGRSPLIEALTYPDRRVQYEAALALAHALPQQKFEGDQAVVPILASAVRQGTKSLALLIVDNDENRTNMADQLQKMDFDILGSGPNASAVGPDLARAVGVDLVVIRVTSSTDAKNSIESLRRIPKSAAAPILVIAGAIDEEALGKDYRHDPRVIVTRALQDDAQLNTVIEGLLRRAAGGRMSTDEAEEYAIRSLGALRDIAISRSPAYTIDEAESSLIDALDTRQGGTRMLVADILALIDSDQSQRKLFDSALAATGEDQVQLLHRVSDSVRLFGDKAEERHVQALIELIAKSEGEAAEAAATVHGALNLPTSTAVNLLPKPPQ